MAFLAHPAQSRSTRQSAVKNTIRIRRIFLPDNFIVEPFVLKSWETEKD
jgi:hypothetical protein